jgi:hypothetical protein
MDINRFKVKVRARKRGIRNRRGTRNQISINLKM